MGIVLFVAIEWLERAAIPWNFVGEASDEMGAK